MDEGWLKLHRRSRNSATFKDDALWRLWSYLLMNANWEERKLADGTTLKPGQLIRGIRRIATDLEWSRGKVARWLRRLTALQSITIEQRTGTLAQVITLINYGTYQGGGATSEDSSGATSRATSGATSRAIKKKERKKEGKKERKATVTIPPELADVEAYCRSRNNGIDAETFMAHYGQQGWKLGNGNLMKDWRLAIVTWEKRKKKEDGQPQLFPSQHHDPDRPVTPI